MTDRYRDRKTDKQRKRVRNGKRERVRERRREREIKTTIDNKLVTNTKNKQVHTFVLSARRYFMLNIWSSFAPLSFFLLFRIVDVIIS